MKTKLSLIILGTVVLALTGCETFTNRSQRHASSLLKYLYPNRLEHVDAPAVPVLTLPLRVGVAFVPEDNSRQNSAYVASSALSEQEKVKLLTEVSEQFRKYPFVKSIEVIPSVYLTPGGGFENVDQLRSMFDVDVIALVSYDQVQFTSTTPFSLAYLTVVGTWIMPGEENDTRTMLDAAVYDIPSRKLLFRAPGLSQVKGSSTPVHLTGELKENREHSFTEASTNLVTNLDTQLARFRERVKENPKEIKVVRSAGYTGGDIGVGAVGWPEALMAVALVLASFCARRRCS
jgi:rhombotail lipoprotein